MKLVHIVRQLFLDDIRRRSVTIASRWFNVVISESFGFGCLVSCAHSEAMFNVQVETSDVRQHGRKLQLWCTDRSQQDHRPIIYGQNIDMPSLLSSRGCVTVIRKAKWVGYSLRHATSSKLCNPQCLSRAVSDLPFICKQHHASTSYRACLRAFLQGCRVCSELDKESQCK